MYLVFTCIFRCKVGVPDKTQGVLFSPVPVEFTYFDPERIGVELLSKSVGLEGGMVPIMSDLEVIESVLSKMESNIERLMDYVKSVIVCMIHVHCIIRVCVCVRLHSYMYVHLYVSRFHTDGGRHLGSPHPKSSPV